MTEPLRCVAEDTLITAWDFSTTAVKCLAFNLDGQTQAEVRLTSDLWTQPKGTYELNLMQVEGQARGSTRAMAAALREAGSLHRWRAGGISATHHTAGRIDSNHVQVRRAICWNDETLADYHEKGLERLGGPDKVRELIGAPWAIRYSLSHLVKDEKHLDEEDWKRTKFILPHGSLAAGYLTGNFDVVSVSSAASTGIMDFRTQTWCKGMLGALKNPEHRELAWNQLPKIIDQTEPVGTLSESLAIEIGVDGESRPLIFPTSDDQQAGLVGGGAVDDGQMAVILGSSAVVNSSSSQLPSANNLDAMRLNWGPFLWMRCYSNGAQFLDDIVGTKPDFDLLEREARTISAGCGGVTVLPFAHPEPSLNVKKGKIEWTPKKPKKVGKQFRAALEALAYLIALGVRAHEKAGQTINRITVSGGIARSQLMCEILASVLQKPVVRLVSFEGSALGAAVTALASLESHLRKQQGIQEPYTVADAVEKMVKFRETVEPNSEWIGTYEKGLAEFKKKVKSKK